MKLLIYGSACVDVILRVPHLPRREENLHPSSQRFAVGGCACNVARVPGFGGADVRLVTPVGLRGVYGPLVRDELAGLPWAKPVFLPDEENGCCYCLVEDDGERTFLSVHGAEYGFRAAWTEGLRGFDLGYVCGLELGERDGAALAAWLETRPVRRLLYAPGPRAALIDPALTRRILALSPILHLNAREACALTGADGPEEAAAALFGQTGEAVVCTLGGQGCLLMDEHGLRRQAAVPAAAVKDATGAGDAHCGGLLLGLARGESLDGAARLAGRMAAEAVACEGAAIPAEAVARALAAHGKDGIE